MPKVKISEYSATANSNTDVASINIDEGCAPSGINNAIRAVMGHLKDFQQGTNGDPFNGPVNGTLGATTASTAVVTTLNSTDATDASSTTAAAMKTAGGLGVAKKMFVGLDDITKYTNSNGANPTATIGKVTMRGGYSKFTLSSKEDEVVDYRLYAIWVKPNGVPPAAGALGKSIDIAHSATDTSNESIRILKQWSGLLDRSQSASFFFRAKIKQYDTTLFTAGTDCMYWYLGVGNTIDATAVSVSYIQSFNCSMTMDVTA